MPKTILKIAVIVTFISLAFDLASSEERRKKPEFAYQSFLSAQAPEKSLPIQATPRILKEREGFLGLTSCAYRIGKNNLPPYRGEIKATEPGYVLIVTGYHYLEKPWGRIFQREFLKNISDPKDRVLFLEVQNNNILTGDDSPVSNREIREFLGNFEGKIKLIIEVHEHLSDENKFYGNEWPPYWYQLESRTGHDTTIKYTILDPAIPWFCIRDYFEAKGQIRLAEMQKAINETLHYTVSIINQILAP